MSDTFYQLTATDIDGSNHSFREFAGQALLIVNVASQCGFTNQYTGLEALYRKYCAMRFAVLGFPCNQFGSQEAGSDADIRHFCSNAYDVTFPMFSKIEVNGPNAHPLYQYLKREQPGLLGTEAIKWNFTKFLVSKSGVVLKRFAPNHKPDDLDADVAFAVR
jgi:glutathione peroxidase